MSLGDSGKPLSNVNAHRASPNFCNLSGYLSPLTRLPLIAGSQTLARAIVSLYYSYSTTYIINLNSIIPQSSPGFEPGSPGPKAATLPLYYTPLTIFSKTLLSGTPQHFKRLGNTALCEARFSPEIFRRCRYQVQS